MKIFRLLIVLALAVLPTFPALSQEGPPSDDMEGYCSGVRTRCQEQCFPSAEACMGAGGDPGLCDDQFEVCYEDCVGWFDGFWCGYRAY